MGSLGLNSQIRPTSDAALRYQHHLLTFVGTAVMCACLYTGTDIHVIKKLYLKHIHIKYTEVLVLKGQMTIFLRKSCVLRLSAGPFAQWIIGLL